MLEEVRPRARPYFEDAPPAHDWSHVRRVETLAETLVERHPESPSIDDRVVTLAVLLHDIGRAREDRGEIDDHADWGAREAEGILETVGGEPKTIERVAHCIRAHRYSTGPEPKTLEAKLLSDADNLDALGAIGIARVFAHGGAVGSPIHRSAALEADAEPAERATSQYDHFHEKILELPDRMYTDVGRALADDRVTFVQTFLARFDAELAAER